VSEYLATKASLHFFVALLIVAFLNQLSLLAWPPISLSILSGFFAAAALGGYFAHVLCFKEKLWVLSWKRVITG